MNWSTNMMLLSQPCKKTCFLRHTYFLLLFTIKCDTIWTARCVSKIKKNSGRLPYCTPEPLFRFLSKSEPLILKLVLHTCILKVSETLSWSQCLYYVAHINLRISNSTPLTIVGVSCGMAIESFTVKQKGNVIRCLILTILY